MASGRTLGGRGFGTSDPLGPDLRDAARQADCLERQSKVIARVLRIGTRVPSVGPAVTKFVQSAEEFANRLESLAGRGSRRGARPTADPGQAAAKVRNAARSVRTAQSRHRAPAAPLVAPRSKTVRSPAAAPPRPASGPVNEAELERAITSYVSLRDRNEVGVRVPTTSFQQIAIASAGALSAAERAALEEERRKLLSQLHGAKKQLDSLQAIIQDLLSQQAAAQRPSKHVSPDLMAALQHVIDNFLELLRVQIDFVTDLEAQLAAIEAQLG